ncbi:hypothetical protein GCM10007920_05090 [Ciceribacter naphthalenivorans]|uniref:Uncharacterized protein n=3 Tax=Pseudomonadota TaxID=1224 RepID=A0A512HGS0_9HYPH|nr:hypothetical protein RNA01_15860 [Ciceribacter naphthalenivorans]GLR20725.1 hypothetical protein GCM10007920_05090 [Ciceribacter naphthalenivorans]GLT03581.1 hypothetical protein GCM10007926_05090 [Sphingomonas psychrolutea]
MEDHLRQEILKFTIALVALLFAMAAWWFIGGQAIPLAALTMVGALYNQTPWGKYEKDPSGK